MAGRLGLRRRRGGPAGGAAGLPHGVAGGLRLPGAQRLDRQEREAAGQEGGTGRRTLGRRETGHFCQEKLGQRALDLMLHTHFLQLNCPKPMFYMSRMSQSLDDFSPAV